MNLQIDNKSSINKAAILEPNRGKNLRPSRATLFGPYRETLFGPYNQPPCSLSTSV